MLVLTRKVGESIVIRDDIRVVLVSMEGNKCRLGVEAPADIPVHRQEIYDKIKSRDETAISFSGKSTANDDIADELRAAGADTFSGEHLILDFANVRTIRSFELGTLIKFHKRLTSRGVSVTLTGLDANIRELFSITRLDTYMTIAEGRKKIKPLP